MTRIFLRSSWVPSRSRQPPATASLASRSPRAQVLATHGMVATSVPLATQIGLDVLKKGGTAVDAAIAANAALS
jgi:gamma-glutamyltranspeptidase/glutathione hydrolase